MNELKICLISLVCLCFGSCKRVKTERIVISTFNVADYEFDVEHVKKTDRWRDRVVADYIDTVLVNVCDFCADCEQDEDSEPMTSHGE